MTKAIKAVKAWAYVTGDGVVREVTLYRGHGKIFNQCMKALGQKAIRVLITPLSND
jgi:hypothetical protein